MSAEILRRAAALMRERAEATADRTNTPWEVAEGVGNNRAERRTLGQFSMVHDNAAEVAILRGFRDERQPVAVYIASWHPAVALAVADWLDMTAQCMDEGCELHGVAAPLNVARAYLGSDA